jgi:protein SCO1
MSRLRLLALAVLLLAVGGLLLSNLMNRSRLDPNAAGVAYIEEEDGTLRKASEVRAEKRTRPAARAPKGSEADWLSEFELTERSGKLISSSSFKGRPYVVGFFFATCPSICVRQNEKMKSLQEKFRGQPIRLVGISCDPEVDRPEVLAEYAARFHADPEQWLFFTGDMDYITRVGSEMFSLGVMRRGHPEKFALVDAEGKVYGLYTWSDPAQWQALQRDMEKLISEQPEID